MNGREQAVGWLVGCFGFSGPLRQYFSLYQTVSQREEERGEKGQRRVKLSKQRPPAPIASAIGPCPTITQIVGHPGTGSLPRTIAPPDLLRASEKHRNKCYTSINLLRRNFETIFCGDFQGKQHNRESSVIDARVGL